MAKKKRETGLPVVIALVFFLLTTVGLGVFCYVLYSDQIEQQKVVESAKKDAAGSAKLAKEAQELVKVYRIALGIPEPGDLETLTAESKPGDIYAAELKKLNEALDAKLKQVKPAEVTTDLNAKTVLDWAPDAENKIPPAGPRTVILDAVAKFLAQQEIAKQAADAKVKTYDEAATALKAKADAFDVAVADLKGTAAKLTDEITKTLEDIKKASAARQSKFEDDTKDLRGKIDEHVNSIARLNTKLRQTEERLAGVMLDVQALQETKKKGEQFFDEPVGKILRRLPDNTVEIDLGFNDKAMPGLTFSVLPADFPIRGYQSRVRVFREPDDRNVFREVTRFVEKGIIEIVEILGPHSARARIVSETDPIRDRVLVGDLLYNAVWRRGSADHVALFGVFDTNGDGRDDIKNVVRDLERMGIPVDAYFDLTERKWIGTLSARTRYAIKGYAPNPSGNDPYAGEKAALNAAISQAAVDVRNKGITEVSFREIFPRIGYRVKMDVTDDKINQAVSQYLQVVGTPMQ